ncbi:MAG TPA: TonB family protein [Pyrinomonadaceae bacterium]|nr:TonB family protein [Pyrinomonadaceae bacterium]
MSNFDARFMKDEELHDLLEHWSVPDAPQSLDNRVAAAYNNLMGDAVASNSPLHPQRDSEVVKMKFCNTCQEQFADRFSFCPVDGTPLGAAPAPSVSAPARDIETSYPVAESAVPKPGVSEPAYAAIPASSAASSAAIFGEYHLTILEDRGLLYRLADELGGVAHNYQLTWPEFKRDPFGFVKRSIQGYGQMVGGFFGSRDILIAMLFSVVAIAVIIGMVFFLDRTQSAGVSRKPLIVIALLGFCGLLAIFSTWLRRDRDSGVMGARPADSRNALSGIVVSFVMVFAVIGGLFFWDMHQRAKAADKTSDEDLELTQMISDIPNEQPTPDEGTAGMAKGNGGGSKPKQEKAGGGGGGGRQEKTDASNGKLPQADLRIPPVVAPDPHPPVFKNPALPMPAQLDADKLLFPADARNLNYGDPKSRSTTPSSGPGSGNGIGSGNGGGVGPGSGGGYGPGEGGNTGGGSRHEGGGGPGGGGGGTDYTRTFNPSQVTTKARVLEKPEPQYTEAARKNQITGTVVIKAVFSTSGQVTNIVAISKLPDGLTEKAIAAARQIRFVPATKDGRPVSMYVQLEYNFNLY